MYICSMTDRPVNYILDANWYRDSAVYLEYQLRNSHLPHSVTSWVTDGQNDERTDKLNLGVNRFFSVSKLALKLLLKKQTKDFFIWEKIK